MIRLRRSLVLACLLLAACSSPSATPTTPTVGARLPTRLPTATPTATPFAVPAEAYHQRGLERQQDGDLEGARRHFTWAIQRDAAFAPAYLSRASTYLAEGRLDRALEDVDAALAIEEAARAYVLRGEILRAMGHPAQARQAFERALARDPALRDLTFRSRWEVARAIDDVEHLSTLASEYATTHPEDWLGYYYQGWASLQAKADEEAIALLIEGIEGSSDQPALLWYLLGRAYTRIQAWSEAVTSLEVARQRLEAGDITMAAHTERPSADLFVALGRAYLGAGRCADAETALSHGISAGAPPSEHADALEQAQACETPTPPP